MTRPRGLSAEEAAAWARVAATVEPLDPPTVSQEVSTPGQAPQAPKSAPPQPSPPTPAEPPRPPRPAPGPPTHSGKGGLDGSWEKRLRGGSLVPDFTLDLHEHRLDAAYSRLLGGLDIARETGARVVLVIAGRERPGPAADRAAARGAIRAKLLDWLAASRHAPAIAAIRNAHRRHGGEGALYIILRRPR